VKIVLGGDPVTKKLKGAEVFVLSQREGNERKKEYSPVLQPPKANRSQRRSKPGDILTANREKHQYHKIKGGTQQQPRRQVKKKRCQNITDRPPEEARKR